MKLVDILGLGSSSFIKSKGSSPFFGNNKLLTLENKNAYN